MNLISLGRFDFSPLILILFGLLLPELYLRSPDHTALGARDVVVTFRSRRIKVGTGANFKINFSPAREV